MYLVLCLLFSFYKYQESKSGIIQKHKFNFTSTQYENIVVSWLTYIYVLIDVSNYNHLMYFVQLEEWWTCFQIN